MPSGPKDGVHAPPTALAPPESVVAGGRAGGPGRRRLVDMTTELYLELSPDLVVSDCNERVAEVSGWSRADLVGSRLDELVLDPRSVREVTEVVRALVATGPDGRPARIADLWVRTRDARTLEIEGVAWVDEGEHGPCVRALAREAPHVAAGELGTGSANLHDHLTGLPSRTMFSFHLSFALARQQTNGSSVAVMLVDLDRFQSVNDSFGHDVGDEVLDEVGRRISGLARSEDVVARFGGDEFLVLFEGDEAEQVVKTAAAALLEALTEPVATSAAEVYVTASIGAVLADVGDDESRLIANAGIAMSRAKRRGGRRLEIFHESMRPGSVGGAHTESSLNRALDRGEFEVYYQPVVAITDRRLVAVEALVRWNHPSQGLLVPNDFIRLAEQTGLVVPLGAWVLRDACRSFVEWSNAAEANDAVRPVESIEVNLSARQISDPGIFDMVRSALVDSGIEPGAVMLEITESALMEDPEAALRVLRRLKNLGVRLSVDDFGTGFSSLSYLRRFPLDGLKIDRSFIVELASSPDDVVIVATIVNLAHALGLEVIAEGIETENQLAALEATGCDLFQGFLTSEALPVDRLAEILPGLGFEA